MIHKTFGNIEILITDASFGHVVPGDPTFDDRLRTRGLEVFPNVWMDQQHTNLVQHAGKPGVLKATDGIYTNESGLRLVTKTADCVPILLWNTRAHLIAAIHAGWKGFVGDIIESFATLRHDDHEPQLSDFRAFLGPHLRVEHFEVKEDFIDALPESKKSYLVQRDGKWWYDLTKGVLSELNQIGITEVEDCGIDTYSSADYFSYRRWRHLPDGQRPENYPTFANCIILT